MAVEAALATPSAVAETAGAAAVLLGPAAAQKKLVTAAATVETFEAGRWVAEVVVAILCPDTGLCVKQR